MAGLQSPQDDFGQQKREAATPPGQAPGQSWQQPQPNGQPLNAEPQDSQPQDGQQQHVEERYGQPEYQQVQPYAPQQSATTGQGQPATGLTSAQRFWYVVQCIAMGAGYFAKIPPKKALSDYGMAQLTPAEEFWYILQCCAFGAGYFKKLSTAKALSEMPQFQTAGYR